MAGAGGPQRDDHPLRGQLQETWRHGGEERHWSHFLSISVYREATNTQVHHQFTPPIPKMCLLCITCQGFSSFDHADRFLKALECFQRKSLKRILIKPTDKAKLFHQLFGLSFFIFLLGIKLNISSS